MCSGHMKPAHGIGMLPLSSECSPTSIQTCHTSPHTILINPFILTPCLKRQLYSYLVPCTRLVSVTDRDCPPHPSSHPQPLQRACSNARPQIRTSLPPPSKSPQSRNETALTTTSPGRSVGQTAIYSLRDQQRPQGLEGPLDRSGFSRWITGTRPWPETWEKPGIPWRP